MHVRRHLDAQHDVQFVAHQRRTSFRSEISVGDVHCVRSQDERDERYVPLYNVECAPTDFFKWPGRTTVSAHPPVKNHQAEAKCQLLGTYKRVLRSKDKKCVPKSTR